jgi:DNA-directed RNA polymerase subunit RPC12/RpoP
MSAMVGFWAVCIFTTRKNKLLKHGTGGLNMSDYISREAMSETPKCPYCGDRMKIRVSLTTPDWRLLSAQYKCMTCESTSPRLEFIGNTSQAKIEERLQDVSSRRAKPKNRVLTLEELKVYTGFLWKVYNGFDCEGAPAFAEKGFMYAGNGNVDLRQDISDTYGKNWRCWLRKPTEAERRETPWG